MQEQSQQRHNLVFFLFAFTFSLVCWSGKGPLLPGLQLLSLHLSIYLLRLPVPGRGSLRRTKHAASAARGTAGRAARRRSRQQGASAAGSCLLPFCLQLLFLRLPTILFFQSLAGSRQRSLAASSCLLTVCL